MYLKSCRLVGFSTLRRPWYRNRSSTDDPGASEKHGGDVLQQEPCAITTRASPSFIRVGSFELYRRRVLRGDTEALADLQALARHTLFRDFPDIHGNSTATFQEKVVLMAEEAAERFSALAAHWLRVGYAQSNFNSDNCLVSGATLDYGPFGFIEKFDPGWSMWIGSGPHYSFFNQPQASGFNYFMFASSLKLLLDSDGQAAVDAVIRSFEERAASRVSRMWARKLGFEQHHPEVEELSNELFDLMARFDADFTILFRQLAHLPRSLSRGAHWEEDAAQMLHVPPQLLLSAVAPAFYSADSTERWQAWLSWLQRWLSLLTSEGRGPESLTAGMLTQSPKYVPREWMLVEAYSAAEKGDATVLHTLQRLFEKPYDEQPEFESRYYQRAPASAADQGGVGFMS